MTVILLSSIFYGFVTTFNLFRYIGMNGHKMTPALLMMIHTNRNLKEWAFIKALLPGEGEHPKRHLSINILGACIKTSRNLWSLWKAAVAPGNLVWINLETWCNYGHSQWETIQVDSERGWIPCVWNWCGARWVIFLFSCWILFTCLE